MANAKHGFTVGQAVHYSFNGDSYSANVVRTTKLQVVLDNGMLFTLRANGAVRSAGHGTWRLGDGHMEKRNPCF